MRSELLVKTRSLSGSSDLTLLAPIKQGLVPSLESVTYKTRVKRLLKTLNAGRSSSHEYALLRPISDAVERVGKIHSVRVAVLEPEDKVLLAVTFDGAWDSYIRVLWQKVGALLDVIFCNTIDYVSAYDHSFEEWVAWAHRVQVETAFFYGKPAHTVDDVFYLKEQETLHRKSPAQPSTDLESTQLAVRRVETVAWEVTTEGHYEVYPETAKLGLQALAALYRLTDVYFPASDDGKYLHRAARELLLEFVRLIEHTRLLEIPIDLVKERFDKQLVWLRATEADSASGHREPPELPCKAPPDYNASDVQGGILSPYEGITHGCLLLTAFDGPASAAEFLARLNPKITRDDAGLGKGDLVYNIAFTYEGLRALGLSETQLACFPQEFREGMEARAGVLGDFHMNHPRRWHLPVRNWPNAADEEGRQVELNAVHAVVQLRVGTTDADRLKINELNDSRHPLHGAVQNLFPNGSGARLLSVQAMRRYLNEANKVTEHFGFADGEGQPVIDPAKAGQIYRNQVHLGELLLGYATEADAPPDADSAASSMAALERTEWLHNGSFLVVRKLKQDVEALETAVGKVVGAGMSREQVLAKMMGRTLGGDPLVPHAGTNDFDYKDDRTGSVCPFQAHIRRANPRFDEVDQRDTEDVPEPPGRRTPRLMRRSMSYGPRYIRESSSNADVQENNTLDRGLVFMAYNANLGEQFEVVQRWLAGGNSTGVFSGQSDPFLGVARNDEPRYFRFEHEGAVKRMSMDGWDALREEPTPIVRLEWGAYLFTPSIAALGKFLQVAQRQACPHAPVWSVADGLRRIAALEALERDQGPSRAALAWKSVLEDPEAIEKFISASVWAAIREHRNGVLRTPYGVLVADRDLVMKVFRDDEGLYSVKGYHDRMTQSIGEIYLGLDASGENGPYAKQSTAPNAAIQAIRQEEAFELARSQTDLELRRFMEEARIPAGNSRWMSEKFWTRSWRHCARSGSASPNSTTDSRPAGRVGTGRRKAHRCTRATSRRRRATSSSRILDLRWWSSGKHTVPPCARPCTTSSMITAPQVHAPQAPTGRQRPLAKPSLDRSTIPFPRILPREPSSAR
jgi:Dyp-type peroxidase family